MKQYKTWSEAREHASGYDSDAIIEKVKGAALEVKRGTKAYERDGTSKEEIHYSWHLLATLLWIASQRGNNLNLIDFGGALGTSYFQNRKFLAHLKKLSWNIVEQKKFVSYGRELFQDEHLRFFYNHELANLLHQDAPDVVLLSSSLQYIEQPYELLKHIVSANPKYIIFDKTPFMTGENGDRVVVQKVSPNIYDASYPCWVFGLEKFLGFFCQHGYRLIEQINHDQREWFSVGSKLADWNGYLFEKIA